MSASITRTLAGAVAIIFGSLGASVQGQLVDFTSVEGALSGDAYAYDWKTGKDDSEEFVGKVGTFPDELSTVTYRASTASEQRSASSAYPPHATQLRTSHPALQDRFPALIPRSGRVRKRRLRRDPPPPDPRCFVLVPQRALHAFLE